MALPRSLWLLSICLLSWCCDAQSGLLENPDSESEELLPVVIWNFIENSTFMTEFKNIIEKTVPGLYILPIHIGKTMMKDVENKVVDASSQVCQILAEDPKLQDGYIAVTFSKGIKFLRAVAQICPIPAMRNMISVSSKKFFRVLKKFARITLQQMV